MTDANLGAAADAPAEVTKTEAPAPTPAAEPAPTPTPVADSSITDAIHTIEQKVEKTAEVLVQEAADHIKHFVEKNLPTLEQQGHDFAGSLGTKLKGWLADVEKFFESKTKTEAAK